MKITKEIKERIDRRGNFIDFVFCFNCCHFLDISDYLPGNNVKCLNCHTDQFLDIMIKDIFYIYLMINYMIKFAVLGPQTNSQKKINPLSLS